MNVEFEENISNYSIYTIRARGLYSALVRVGNTVAFGMSTEENALHVQDILKDLDYWSN